MIMPHIKMMEAINARYSIERIYKDKEVNINFVVKSYIDIVVDGISIALLDGDADINDYVRNLMLKKEII